MKPEKETAAESHLFVIFNLQIIFNLQTADVQVPVHCKCNTFHYENYGVGMEKLSLTGYGQNHYCVYW